MVKCLPFFLPHLQRWLFDGEEEGGYFFDGDEVIFDFLIANF